MPKSRAAFDLLPSSGQGWRESYVVRPRPWAGRQVGVRPLRGWWVPGSSTVGVVSG